MTLPLQRKALLKCEHCGRPKSTSGDCSFCLAPVCYTSPTKALQRYFTLLGASPVPALDPSWERCTGKRSPAPRRLHEQARLSKLLDEALGSGWQDKKQGKILAAVFTPGKAANIDFFAEKEGISSRELETCCVQSIDKLYPIMTELGVLQPKEEPEAMAEPEETFRGWEAIGKRLGFSGETVRRWYRGINDPCNLKQAIKKINNTPVSTESQLQRCWEKLYLQDQPED